MKQFELEICDLSSTGEGVGKHEGLTIFVDGALPTERVLVSVFEEKKNYAKGKIEKILRRAKDRVDPVCEKFEQCGGCQLMHLSYAQQLKVKEKRVSDAFLRIGKIERFTLQSCMPSPEMLSYRNKIQLPVSAGPKIGLYAKRSHEIIPIEACKIHNREGEKVIGEIKKLLGRFSISIYDEKKGRGEFRHLLVKTSKQTGKVLVVLITTRAASKELKAMAREIFQIPNVSGVVHGLNDRKTNAVRGESYTLLEGGYALEESILGIKVQISPASFFQVNPLQAENIYLKAFELGKITEGKRVFDAYCGIGLFACFLAKSGCKVTGIEIIPEAIEDAKKNAKCNDVPVEFICGKVEEEIGKLPRQDIVYLNPPRKGCEKYVLEIVAAMNPSRIIYTSCEEATLARDASVLVSKGYSKISLYPFDMFPQTMHVETVALFEKNS